MIRVLDLGSNSFIVLVLDGEKVLFEKVYEVGLKSLMKDQEKAFEIAKQTLSKALNESNFSCPTYAFGTSVFRENPDFFHSLVKEFGIIGYILSEEEEAMYSYMSIDPNFEMDITVVDLGGGSLEIVRKNTFKSYPLGTHVLNSLFDLTLPGAKDFEKAVFYVKEQISQDLGKVYTVGGSFVAIAAFKKGRWDLKSLDGETITQKDVLNVFEKVKNKSLEEIKSMQIIPQGRERTLVAGLVVAFVICELSKEVIVSTKGYRHAVARMLEKTGRLTQPWRARGDLNSRPPDPQSGALSS
ncbi:Ppx/GppA phosphatase [Pseudothermotoga thermarum DSM 5069]|uniref:Ppx/GppA phosphatase n=1 Tax=Pseudothermotoga thermarum DSM 5069 TaxID=688269 RepID=F7YW62_9THEM|nr:Ppx/GppA phosphatase [Pseudothermotoga thermarum DSM 5069]